MFPAKPAWGLWRCCDPRHNGAILHPRGQSAEKQGKGRPDAQEDLGQKPALLPTLPALRAALLGPDARVLGLPRLRPSHR